jgi:hypothetical protein
MEGIFIRNFLLKWPAAKNAILRQENCVATVDQCPNCFFLGEPADPFRRLHVSTLFRLRHASFDSARYGVFRNSGQPILRTFEDAVRTDEEDSETNLNKKLGCEWAELIKQIPEIVECQRAAKRFFAQHVLGEVGLPDLQLPDLVLDRVADQESVGKDFLVWPIRCVRSMA